MLDNPNLNIAMSPESENNLNFITTNNLNFLEQSSDQLNLQDVMPTKTKPKDDEKPLTYQDIRIDFSYT